MTLEQFLMLVNKLGGVSFATLLSVILFGSYKGIWRWGKDVEKWDAERLASHAAERKMLAEQVEFFRNISLRSTGLLETQSEQLITVARQVGVTNRKLLDGG
jgi:hypothetical protein